MSDTDKATEVCGRAGRPWGDAAWTTCDRPKGHAGPCGITVSVEKVMSELAPKAVTVLDSKGNPSMTVVAPRTSEAIRRAFPPCPPNAHRWNESGRCIDCLHHSNCEVFAVPPASCDCQTCDSCGYEEGGHHPECAYRKVKPVSAEATAKPLTCIMCNGDVACFCAKCAGEMADGSGPPDPPPDDGWNDGTRRNYERRFGAADLDIDAIEAHAASAFPGPWTHDEQHMFGVVKGPTVTGVITTISRSVEHDAPSPASITSATARFVAHARQDVPALIAEVRRLRALLVRERATPQAQEAKDSIDVETTKTWLQDIAHNGVRDVTMAQRKAATTLLDYLDGWKKEGA